MKKLTICALIFSILLTMTQTVFAALPDSDATLESEEAKEVATFDTITKDYYSTPIENMTSAKSAKSITVDYSVATEIYRSDKELIRPDELKAFVEEYSAGGSLLSLGKQTGEFYAMATVPGEGVGSALLDSKGEVLMVFQDGDGSTYKMPDDADFRMSMTNTVLKDKSANVNATYFIITDYAAGILFSSDTEEYYLPLDICEAGTLKTGNIYQVKEVIADIQNNAEKIATWQPLEVTYSEDGKANVPTGNIGNASYEPPEVKPTVWTVIACTAFLSLLVVNFMMKDKKEQADK